MVDPPASNSTNSALVARDILSMKQNVAQNYTNPALSNLATEDGTRTWWIFALLGMILMTILLVVFCLYPKLLRLISSVCNELFCRWAFFEGCYIECFYISPKAAYYFKRLTIVGAILLFVAAWVVVVMNLHKQQRWSAASEFLAACMMQKVYFTPSSMAWISSAVI